MTFAYYCRHFKPAIEAMAAAIEGFIMLISMLVAWDKIPPDETEQELFGDDWDGDRFSPGTTGGDQ